MQDSLQDSLQGSAHDQSILPDTIEALRRLSADSRLRPQERASVEREMREIEDFAAKLENGRLEIAAFGEVGSGKSALLNALAGEQIFAVSAEHGSTDRVAKTGFKNTKLVLVDTPGINEAAGELRGKLAEETVRHTDLVLFVADGDLNRVELDAFNQLSDLHKPIVLVINKADLHGPAQIKEISESVLRKIGNRIGADDIVFAAAAPRESEREIHKADGTIEIVRFQPKPKIEALEARMLEVLDREGKAIIALNASLFASDVSDRIKELKQHVRGKEVTRLIYYFMLGKALVVGANPVPVFDVLAGMATDALMVQRIGAIYGTDFSLKNAQGMVLEILRAWGLMAAAEYGLHLAADLLRTVTFGASTVLTAVPQGLAAAWSTYVVGNAANIYFRDSGWSGRSPKDIVQEILAGSEQQKASILGPIRDQLKAKFGR
jgi:small GTP-binding protein